MEAGASSTEAMASMGAMNTLPLIGRDVEEGTPKGKVGGLKVARPRWSHKIGSLHKREVGTKSWAREHLT